jgi:hypothetical protein
MSAGGRFELSEKEQGKLANNNDESPGGSLILRHEARDEEWAPPAEGVEGTLELIEDHMQSVFGPVETVFHELISDLVHLDVHQILPSDEHPYHVLFTTGMSDLPMTLPEGLDIERRAELMMALPPDWQMSKDAWEDERWYWPIRTMKTLARLPHEYGTWLGLGHTVPNGDPPEPYAPGVPFCCAMIAPPLLLPHDAHVVSLPNGEDLRFLSIVWLHPGEVVLKLNKGADELYDRMDQVECSELLDLNRPDLSRRRKKFLGLF